ncbi:MAG: pyruvate ferredoxin oxidoreductase [Thermoplasmatales archaeon]|jgi:Pyruvate:ferredoxin oxidoreductase and related 2-oxoacid:ferredoxin oxidoreductases, alpha subunit
MRAINKNWSIMTGNEAVALATKLAGVKFVSAYPITPQTAIVEKIAEMVANEKMDAKFIEVESEHSAMASVMGSELAGVRSFTASSSHGILYMHEMLNWVAGMRLPILMAVVNRSIGPPWNIWADHSDTMTQRDTGWMQLYGESNQEAMDTIILGYKLAENKDILLPIMVMQDAFTLSHTSEPVEIRDEEKVREFLGEFNLPFKIDINKPMGYGSLMPPDGPFMELKMDMKKSMYSGVNKFIEITKEFNETFDANFPGPVEGFMMDDADYALITLGSISSTAKHVVRNLRNQGKKVGLLRILLYRPFPKDLVINYLRGLKGFGVVDRSSTYGPFGSLYMDVISSIYGKLDIPAANFIAGLGGRDVRVVDFEEMFMRIMEGEDGEIWINAGVK